MSFETPHYGIGQLLEWARSGHLQLPDFQRPYKWDDERIRSLLVTVLRDHPMGVLMVLASGGDNVRFKPKPIAGASDASGEPGLLLLDGQQRTTSLFQALSGDGVVDTEDDRKKQLRRRYFLDIQLALGDAKDQDAAVLSIPESGIVRENFGKDIVLDVSTEAQRLKLGIMPLTAVFGPGGASSWMVRWLTTADPEEMAKRAGLMEALNDRVFIPLTQYKIPAIKLECDTSKEAVATVFEKVNTGGLALNVFELLTATFAGDGKYFNAHGTDFRLREDWDQTAAEVARHPVLADFKNTDFLQAVSLLASLRRRQADIAAGKPKPSAVSARREDILALDLDEYLEWAPKLRDALPWLAHFLTGEHFHTARDLSYGTQLVPLLTFPVVLGSDIDIHAVRARIRQWFWCGVFGELYGSTVETKFGRDIEQVPTWALAAKVAAEAQSPDTITRAGFFEGRLLSLRTRQSAAYKGVYALLMAQKEPCVDWKVHQIIDHASYESMQVDIHHVFPKAWCLKNDIDPNLRESIVNKTPLAKRTNISLGGVSPKDYMTRLDSYGSTPDEVDAFIRTHAIEPATLRTGDFDAYFRARTTTLLDLIEQAMGKPVARQADVIESESDQPSQFETTPDDPEDAADELDAPVYEEAN
jgi:hypothetical protein